MTTAQVVETTDIVLLRTTFTRTIMLKLLMKSNLSYYYMALTKTALPPKSSI